MSLCVRAPARVQSSVTYCSQFASGGHFGKEEYKDIPRCHDNLGNIYFAVFLGLADSALLDSGWPIRLLENIIL